MKTKPTVTIGIPALNEGNNIGCLLSDILKQQTLNYTISKIIVSSDGSTDNTIAVARAIKFRHLEVIDNKDRRGVSARQNQIISHTNSDILVILNADIRILDPEFVSRLIQPIIDKKADLTSPSVREFSPRTFIESTLNIAMRLKTVLFETWRSGNNGYMCHGTARAFSKSFFSKLSFTADVGEDMYSYLECLRLRKVFKYVKDTAIWYRNPDNVSDQLKQSTRFIKCHADFSAIDKYRSITGELHIPALVIVLALVRSLPVIVLHPIQTLAYLILTIYMRFRIKYLPFIGDLWLTSSTKKAV